MLDGDDLVKLTGNVDDGIMIRIIGGDGADEIIDSSKVNGYFLSVSPIPTQKIKLKFMTPERKRVLFIALELPMMMKK